jgi:hypothetical protein
MARGAGKCAFGRRRFCSRRCSARHVQAARPVRCRCVALAPRKAAQQHQQCYQPGKPSAALAPAQGQQSRAALWRAPTTWQAASGAPKSISPLSLTRTTPTGGIHHQHTLHAVLQHGAHAQQRGRRCARGRALDRGRSGRGGRAARPRRGRRNRGPLAAGTDPGLARAAAPHAAGRGNCCECRCRNRRAHGGYHPSTSPQLSQRCVVQHCLLVLRTAAAPSAAQSPPLPAHEPVVSPPRPPLNP